MKLQIVGVGMGNPETLTRQAERAIAQSDCLIGAQRMLEAFKDLAAVRFASCSPTEILEHLSRHPEYRTATVLMSGDVGFYSGAKGLCSLIERDASGEFEVVCIPGVSSVQYFCALLQTSWDDAKLLSLHGREQDLLAAVMTCPKVFLLTGGENTPRAVCGRLTKWGLGDVRVWVGERLSYPDEAVIQGSARELAERDFAPLSVMLVCNPLAQAPPPTHGLPDEAFLRGGAPMTKSEVRAVSIAQLRLHRGDVVWDVGAGTGSVCCEIARVLPDGAVYAVERDAEALELLRQNRQRMGLYNLHIAAGEAPDALETLPAPDAVFIGGSGGGMAKIVASILRRNLAVRIVANAITLETMAEVLNLFRRFALPHQEVLQLTSARAHTAGNKHMMMGQNPIWILSGGGRPDNAG